MLAKIQAQIEKLEKIQDAAFMRGNLELAYTITMTLIELYKLYGHELMTAKLI